jgi:hypothetical protein
MLLTAPGTVALVVADILGAAPDGEYVAWAQALLESHDSPSLRQLAVEEPPFFRPQLSRLFRAVFTEAGEPFPDGPQAVALLARSVAQLCLAGALPLSEGVAQLYRLSSAFPGQLDDGFWQVADEAPDCDYCWGEATGTYPSLEAAIRAHLLELVGPGAG